MGEGEKDLQNLKAKDKSMQNSLQFFFVPKLIILTVYKPLPLRSCEADE